MWASRQWRKLLNLIDRLPQNSWYSQAVANNEEHAKILLKLSEGQPKQPYSPPMASWSAEAGLLADLIDTVNGLKAVMIMSNGGKKPDLKPYPRPSTMMAKVKRDQRMQRHRELVALVLPQEEREGE